MIADDGRGQAKLGVGFRQKGEVSPSSAFA